MLVFGDMPCRVLRPLASCWSEVAVPAILALLRWEMEAAVGAGQRSCVNKLCVCSPDLFLEIYCCVEEMVAAGRRFFLGHRGDGVGDRGCEAPLRSARQGAAVLLGVHQPRPRSAEVINGFRGRCALWCLMHCSFCNLQAGVPSGKPFCVSVTALLVSPPPSGIVPGDVADGRDVERFFVRGGEGLDCCCFTGPFGVLLCSKKKKTRRGGR